MKKIITLLTLSVFLFLVSCAPSTVVAPSELAYNGDFENVFAAASQVIATQTYLSHQSGWIVDANDQVGGLIKTHINGKTCAWLFGCTGDIEQQGVMSATFVKKSENVTAISLSGSGDGTELMNRISQVLEEKFGSAN